MKDLITILNDDGTTTELWGLLKNARDIRQRESLDLDYVGSLQAQLKSTNVAKANEAKAALIWLNSFVLASLDGNFKPFAALGILPLEEFKKEIFNSRNAAQRCYTNCNIGASDELTDATEGGSSIGTLVEAMRSIKKNLRASGISVNEIHARKPKQEIKSEPLPIKKYTKEEIEQLTNQRATAPKKGK